MPGDIDNSNRVTVKDLQLAQDKNGKSVKTVADVVYDIDGNGSINSTDILLLNRLLGSVLPGAPTAPLNKSSSSTGGTKAPFAAPNGIITPDYISIDRGTLSDRYNKIQANEKWLSQLPQFIEKVGPGLFHDVATENAQAPTINPFRGHLPAEPDSNEIETDRSSRFREETLQPWDRNSNGHNSSIQETVAVDASHADASYTYVGYIDAYMEKVEEALLSPLRKDVLAMRGE